MAVVVSAGFKVRHEKGDNAKIREEKRNAAA